MEVVGFLAFYFTIGRIGEINCYSRKLYYDPSTICISLGWVLFTILTFLKFMLFFVAGLCYIFYCICIL